MRPMNHQSSHRANKTSEPIRSIEDLNKVKAHLSTNPRNLCLWVVGTNTALRVSDLVRMTVGDVRGLQAKGELRVREKKTQKDRIIPLNQGTVTAIQAYLSTRPNAAPAEPLFLSGKKGPNSEPRGLEVSVVSRMVKLWIHDAGVPGEHFSAHTMRKTWGFFLRAKGAPIETIQKAFNHSSGAITLIYLGILASEVAELYEMEL